MTAHFVKHDASGRIQYIANVPASMLHLQGSNIVAGKARLMLDYVVDGIVTPRPENPATLNGTVLMNLPNPSTVTINGTAYTVTDGELDMTFPNPGTYAITISSPFPFLDASFNHTQ